MQEGYVRWLVAGGIALGAWVLGWLIRKLIFGRLATVFARTESHLDDLIFEAVRPHVPFWFFLLGLVSGARIAPIPGEILALIDKGATTFFIISISFVASRVAVHVVNYLSARHGATTPTTGVTLGIVKGLVLLLGALMVLSSLGIAIGPLLGALGIGSLAIALALQPTLSNLFAGALITATKRVRTGDYIELDTGHAGYVLDIGWRATQIREREDNLILIPNSKLADSIVRNFALPNGELAVPVRLSVGYDSDLARVEVVTLEVAREVLRTIAGGVPEFAPTIRFSGFGDSGINFTAILRARDFDDRPLLVHEFTKRLYARFKAEGIEIPYPQRELRIRRKDRPAAGRPAQPQG